MSEKPPNLPGHVSRETTRLLEVIVHQVKAWQKSINLVSPTSLKEIWERHVEDSLQLVGLAPGARRWLDLGSGGGFPGLVVAASFAQVADFHMILVEGDGKKCAFLRETARLASLPVEVRHERIENFAVPGPLPFDVVSARALAPLPKLLPLVERFIADGAIGLFHKGKCLEEEIAAATIAWHLEFDLIQSQTESGASILRVRSAKRRPGPATDRPGK